MKLYTENQIKEAVRFGFKASAIFDWVLLNFITTLEPVKLSESEKLIQLRKSLKTVEAERDRLPLDRLMGQLVSASRFEDNQQFIKPFLELCLNNIENQALQAKEENGEKSTV